MKMDQICCRLCMQEHSLMIKIFGKHRGHKVIDLITRFIPEIFLSENENLSKVICQNCFDILVNCDDLKRSSIENDKIQRSMIEDKKPLDVKVEIIEDDDHFEPFNTYMSDSSEDSIQRDIKPLSVRIEKLPDDININDIISEYKNENSRKRSRKKTQREESPQKKKKNKERDRNRYVDPPHLRTCEGCGKIFARRDYMLLHFNKQHASSNGIFYKCDICFQQKSVKSRARLEEHMMLVHLKNREDQQFIYYECPSCKVTYMDPEDLKTHSRYVHEKEIEKPRQIKCNKSYAKLSELEPIADRTCKICNDFFNRSDSLRYHMKTVHKSYHPEGYHCDLCERGGSLKVFHVKAQLQRHMMIKHMGMPPKKNKNYFECDYCCDSYLNFEELLNHSLYVHSKPVFMKDAAVKVRRRFKQDPDEIKEESGRFHCELCPESFNTASRLYDHRFRVHEIGYKCLKCNIEFEAKRDLILHDNVHEDFIRKLPEHEIAMKYECIMCAFKSFNENDLYQHITCHVNEFTLNTTGKLLVCNNCSTILKDYDSLHSHVEVHNEIVTHECLKCKRKFPLNDKFLRHIYMHKTKQRYKCPYDNCKFKCGSNPNLQDHIRHRHLEEVIHLCSMCGQNFGNQGSLRNHIKNIHERSNEVYACNMCPKKFRAPAHLRNHQAVHTTVASFKCEYPGCPKVFKAKRNLQLHTRYHNKDKLNYKYHCEFCERKFLTRDALKRHTYSHTKVKPYVCTFAGCDRAFSQSNDLNKHLRTHYQQEETYFCSYLNCKQSFRLKSELRYHEGLHYQNNDPAPKEQSP